MPADCEVYEKCLFYLICEIFDFQGPRSAEDVGIKYRPEMSASCYRRGILKVIIGRISTQCGRVKSLRNISTERTLESPTENAANYSKTPERTSVSGMSSSCKIPSQRPLDHMNRSSLSMAPVQEDFKFSFADYDIIGFDLDGTLLRYNLNEMIPLQYELMRRFLVEERGYPRKLLDQTLDPSFIQKGLIIDAAHGNILKLNKNAVILRASHGTRALSVDDICRRYGDDRKWTVSTQFFEDPLSTWNGPLSAQLRTLLDYFDLPASMVFAQAVDILDEKAAAGGLPPPTSYTVWADLADSLMQMYTRENFANGQSAYFAELRANPSRYLIRTPPRVLRWLQELRASGKALYLLTGSNVDFANFTANYALGEDWQKYFDSVVCFAKKPGFFTAARPFLRVEGFQERPDEEVAEQDLQPKMCYSQGNWRHLQALLAKKVGKEVKDTRSLYVGDNLIQDVYSPVKHHDMEAVAISEEMLSDVGTHAKDYEFHKIVASEFWGSYFAIDGDATLWAAIIDQYCRLCVPTVDAVAGTPVTQRFVGAPKDSYFPETPEALKS